MASRAPARKRSSPKAAASVDIFELIGRSENIREASAAMQAMAHPVRLKILCLVGNQELSVLEIVDAVGTTQSNISQHLAVLRDHGLLQARKEANKVFYRIGDPRVLKMISLTRDIFCRV
jgi:ArsR family transcriptional regulator